MVASSWKDRTFTSFLDGVAEIAVPTPLTVVKSLLRSKPQLTGEWTAQACDIWFRQLLTLLQKFSYEIVVCYALSLPLFFKLAWLVSASRNRNGQSGVGD